MACNVILASGMGSRRMLPPSRLNPFVPPPNFGAVKDGLIFRSAFPQPRNLSFMSDMNLKTILCLVDTENSQESTDFIASGNIKRLRIDVAANKDGNVKSTMESIYEALLIVMDVTNYPLLIHCNQGKHRTGCVIACLRRMQNWPIKDILEEYEAYAIPKARDGDKKLITEIFDTEAMLDYVKNNVVFEHRPSLMQLFRSDLVSVTTLVNILASTDGVSQEHESLKSNTSKADSGIELGTIVEEDVVDPPVRIVEAVEVSVEECGPMSP
ncbi:hypothetical protein AMS68_002986 [Peltaster fructicola]|uniref:Tyrosine specific protein phosphatases domain-containing protein n=1 Tax=Peltaster fructicola TaxID=286661 RepID=A0A6H0XS67_9PEZI|nr:hypothetical protein AMS68_002986 [Peltaster fructicola]